MTRRPMVLLLTLLSALLTTPACVQILGLEEAKLDEQAGGAGRSSIAAAVVDGECDKEPPNACKACLAECDGDQAAACGQDTSCWVELDVWAECLGSDCSVDSDDELEACWMAVARPRLKTCVATCADDCGASKLVPECQVLCSCMADTCGDAFDTCMTSCSEQPTEVSRCWRSHCFSGNITSDDDDRARHCQHARGAFPDLCPSYGTRPRADRTFCVDGQENGWGCNEPSDCCSSTCDDGVCVDP